jgi:hypothetical protein
MAAKQEPTIDKLRKLCEEVEGRLLENEDYQIYVALKKTIEDYEYHKRELENAVEGKAAPNSGLGRSAAKHLSQREATAMVLEEAKQPMAIETLLPRLQEMGVIFRAKSPKASLSAQLSSSESFQLVEFGGRRCWWFAGRPIP